MKRFTEIGDLHIQGQGVGVWASSPDGFQQKVTIHRQIQVCRQDSQKIRLAGSDQYLVIARTDLIRGIVEGRVSEMEALLLHVFMDTDLKTVLDTGDQLFRIEGFRQVIVSAQAKTFQTVVLIGTVGKEKDK